MTDPTEGIDLGHGEFLTVRVGGADGSDERLLVISRPHEGLVRVREWTTRSWSKEGDDYEIDPSELLESLEVAFASRLPVSEEMYRIRRWLSS